MRFFRSSPLGTAAAVLVVVAVVVATFAGQVAPYDPLHNDYTAARQPPSAQHLLGTDSLGRDVLSRIIYGLRISLIVSVASIALGVSFGVIWGVTSGYAAGTVRLAEPALDRSAVFVSDADPGHVAVGGTRAGAGHRDRGGRRHADSTGDAHHALGRAVGETDAVRRGGALPGCDAGAHHGASDAPQCVAPVAVIATLNLGAAIFAEAALSFLGVGVPPPTPSLGNMLGGVLAQSFQPPWWLVIFPGAAIALTVLAANLLGDSLRDFLDPKLIARLG